MFEDTLDMVVKKVPQRVGFWPRALVSLIDLFILILLMQLLTSLIASSSFATYFVEKGTEDVSVNEEAFEIIKKFLEENFDYYMIYIAISSTISIIYNLVEAFTGASIGKMILGFKVANIDGTRGDINLYMKRWLIKNAASIIVIVNLIFKLEIIGAIAQIVSFVIFLGCFSVLGDKKLALHDTIANSAVYKKKDIID
jgi:uncharacterized RDD family membrane protein YckC